MPTVDQSIFMTPPLAQVLSESIPEFAQERETPAHVASVEAWEEHENRLIDWGQRAGSCDDEGFQFPTRPAIREAFHLLKKLREANMPLPVRVVPTGDAGVSIELVSGEKFAARFDIDEGGAAEFLAFKNCKLLTRQNVD